MPVRELSDYFHMHLVLPNTQPDRNITLLVAMLLRRPYQITIGQKCFTVVRNYTRHRNKNFSLNVFILSKTELHHAKQKICFCFTALSVTLHWNKNKMFLFHSVFSDLAVKQKQNVFVSLSFWWFGSETKTFCFCFTVLFLALLAFHKKEAVVAKVNSGQMTLKVLTE